jgi:transposase-like protein
MATSKKRRVFTASEKAKILAEAAFSTAPAVAKVHGIHPQMIYAWKAAKKKKRQATRKAGANGKAITRAAEDASNVKNNGQSNGKAKAGRAASLDAVHAQLTEALAGVEAMRAAFRNVFGVDA